MNWYCSDTVLENTSLESFEVMVFDMKRMFEKTEQIKEWGIIEENDKRLVAWSTMSFGMLMSSRFGCYQCDRMRQPDGSMVITTRTVQHPEAPAHLKNHVSINCLKYSKYWKEGTDLHIVEHSMTDLGGYIPSSLMNMVMGSLMAKGYPMIVNQLKEIQTELDAKK